jgi:hypothetical protein
METETEFFEQKRKQNFTIRNGFFLAETKTEFAKRKWKKLNLFLAETEMKFCQMKMKIF